MQEAAMPQDNSGLSSLLLNCRHIPGPVYRPGLQHSQLPGIMI